MNGRIEIIGKVEELLKREDVIKESLAQEEGKFLH